MTSDIVSLLMEVLARPDAERPYVALAKAYGNAGMAREAEAIMFLVGERFGGGGGGSSNPHEEQRKDDLQDA